MLDDLGWAVEGRERRNVVEGGILGQKAGVWRRQVLLIGSLKRHLVRGVGRTSEEKGIPLVTRCSWRVASSRDRVVSAFLFDTMREAVMGCVWVMGGNCVILLRRDFLLVAITAVNIINFNIYPPQ